MIVSDWFNNIALSEDVYLIDSLKTAILKLELWVAWVVRLV
jgi:hypothetical protein